MLDHANGVLHGLEHFSGHVEFIAETSENEALKINATSRRKKPKK